jgi:dTDP-L-rhamnose 4-epimerase
MKLKDEIRMRLTSDTCLVTGGAGFIGCAISLGLMQRFGRVVVVDNLHSQIHAVRERPGDLAPRVELVVADVTDVAAWDNLLAEVRPACVIHLVAETGTGQSLTDAGRHARTNVVGTATMLDALARHEIVPRRFVLASSRAVYGEGAWRDAGGEIAYPGQRTREQLERQEWDFPGLRPIPSTAATTWPAPVSVYGATKLAQEHVLSAWAGAFGSDVAILRLQNVYGPGQSLTNPYTGILPLFCRIAAAGDSIPLYEDGEMQRDFVLIDDVAGAILATVDAPVVQPHPVDIGTGKATTIADIARRIAELYGAPAPHVCGRFRPGDVRHASCVLDENLSPMGWRPRHGTDEGLARLVRWIEARLVLGREASITP